MDAELAYFVTGNFDHLNESDPYCAFVSAFSDLCELVLCSVGDLEAISNDLSARLNSDIHILNRLIPSLHLITGVISEIDMAKNWTTTARAHFHLCCFMFLQSMCMRHPVIIFLDDCQWASTESLDLLAFIVCQPECRNLLLVCAYRDDEGFDLNLPAVLPDSMICSTIYVRNLDLGSVNQVLSFLTGCNPIETKGLSQIVFKKCGGNPYYTLRYLEALVADQLMAYDSRTGKWSWDLDRVQCETNPSDNVLRLVWAKIKRLAFSTQKILEIAAVLGFSFNVKLLKMIVVASVQEKSEHFTSVFRASSDVVAINDHIEEHIRIAMLDGLVEKGKGHHHMKFTHDRIHEGIVSLVGAELESLHLNVGRILFESLKNHSDDSLVLLTVEQVDRGIALVSERQEMVSFAQLNLRAARVASSKTAFDIAMKFLEVGISLVERLDDPWNEQYALCRDLFSFGADVGRTIGHFERSESMIEVVIRHSRSMEEKHKACRLNVEIVGASAKHGDAIKLAVSFLRETGDNFPTRPKARHFVLEFSRTRLLVKKFESLLFLPVMRDRTLIHRMQLMSSILKHAQLARDKLCFSLASLRMVQCTARYGLSPESLYGLSKYGMILSFLGATESAFQIQLITMRLLEGLDDKREIEATCVASGCGFLNHLRRPVKQGLSAMHRGFESGMTGGGDTWPSLWCLSLALLTRICYGSVLLESEGHADKLYHLAKTFNHNMILLAILPKRQLVMNLLGHSDTPGLLQGRDIDEFQGMEGSMRGYPAWSHSFSELCAACYFDEWILAERAYVKMCECTPGTATFAKASLIFPCYQFFSGLLHFSMYESTKKRAYLVKAKAIIKVAAKQVKEGMVAMQPVHSFLVAERASLSCEPIIVRQKYDLAITSALNEDSFNFAGIASERGAEHFFRTDVDVAKEFLNTASTCYSRFGSPVLLERVRDKERLLQSKLIQPPLSISIQS